MRYLLPPPIFLIFLGFVWFLHSTNSGPRELSPVLEFDKPQDYLATGSVNAIVVEDQAPVDLVLITDRPLFSPLRSPFRALELEEDIEEIFDEEVIELEPAIEIDIEQPAPPMQPPQVRYIGFLTDGATNAALLRNLNTTQEFWVSTQDIVDDWQVVSISNSEVVLEGRNEILRFPLYE